jgi:gas vesicle protein
MRFLLGLLLGVAVGLAAYLLLSPARKEEVRRRLQDMAGSQDATLLRPLRRAAEEAAAGARQAWQEAQRTARQAEQEMLQRYQRLRQTPRREQR